MRIINHVILSKGDQSHPKRNIIDDDSVNIQKEIINNTNNEVFILILKFFILTSNIGAKNNINFHVFVSKSLIQLDLSRSPSLKLSPISKRLLIPFVVEQSDISQSII